jgi:hypothetical protein
MHDLVYQSMNVQVLKIANGWLLICGGKAIYNASHYDLGYEIKNFVDDIERIQKEEQERFATERQRYAKNLGNGDAYYNPSAGTDVPPAPTPVGDEIPF